MKRIPLTRGMEALVDDEDYARAMSAGPWFACRGRDTFYAQRNTRRADGRHTSQALHKFLTGWQRTDHINRDGLDNQRENLRETTNAENLRNRGRQKNNASGFKGVSWHKGRGKWQAQIRANGQTRALGRYVDPVEAAHAYDEAALELHGEFAALNFPKERV